MRVWVTFSNFTKKKELRAWEDISFYFENKMTCNSWNMRTLVEPTKLWFVAYIFLKC